MAPEVWLHPSQFSSDYRLFFSEAGLAGWPRLRPYVSVLGAAFGMITRATRNQLRDMARFTSSVGCRIAVIGPALKEFAPFGDGQAKRSLAALDRLVDAGGRVDYWYADEPGFRVLASCRAAYADRYGATTEHEILGYAALHFAAVVGRIRVKYPHLSFGVQEPYPALPASGHLDWMNILHKQADLGVEYYHTGIGRKRILLGKGTFADLQVIMQEARARSFRYGNKYNAGPAQNNRAHHVTASEWFPVVFSHLQSADEMLIHHWFQWPDQRILPEDEPWTYANTVLEFLQSLPTIAPSPPAIVA